MGPYGMHPRVVPALAVGVVDRHHVVGVEAAESRVRPGSRRVPRRSPDSRCGRRVNSRRPQSWADCISAALPGFRLDERRFDDLAFERAAAHVDGDRAARRRCRGRCRAGRARCRLSKSERRFPTSSPRRGRPVEHGHVRPQHSPARRRADRAAVASRPGLLLGEQVRRDPRMRPSSSRSPSRSGPAAARCPATARGRAAGSPSRCAACRGRRARRARRPPPRRRRRARRTPPATSSHCGQQFVARARRCSRCGTPAPSTPLNSASA